MMVTRQMESFSAPSVMDIDKKIRSLAQSRHYALDMSICERMTV